MKKLMSIILTVFLIISSATSVFADGYEDMLSKAEAYFEAEEYAHALAAFQLAQRMQPDFEESYLGEAKAHIQMEDYAGALTVVNAALEKFPTSVDAWVLKCRIDIKTKDINTFESDLVFAEVCGVDISDLHPDIAMMYAESGSYDLAVLYFEKAGIDALDDLKKDTYRRALFAIGQREKAESLGLSPISWHDTKIDKAFDNNTLSLVSAQWPEITLDQFEFTDAFCTAMDVNPNEIKPADFEAAEKTVLSISPSGNSAILTVDGVTVGLYNGTYHILYPAYDRGVEDINDNLAKYAAKPFRSLQGEESVVYSHNGRYAAVYNYQITIINYNLSIDPILIDLATGEMFLTETYSNKLAKGNAGGVTTACFSADDRYFYYILYGNTTENHCALYRYDMAAGATELCCSIPYATYYPHLSETADGSFIIIEDTSLKDANQGIVEITYVNEEWIVTRHPFSQPMQDWHVNHMNYSSNSDQALMTGKMSSLINLAFMRVRPGDTFDGMNDYYAIERETNRVVVLDYEKVVEMLPRMMDPENKFIKTEMLSYHAICKTVLSPDGYYALVLTKNGDEAHLFMIRLETMECKEIGGINPLDIRIGLLSSYPPEIEWNGDYVILCTENGIGLFEFE